MQSLKKIGDTGGVLVEDAKDKRIKDLEEEVARLKERERLLLF